MEISRKSETTRAAIIDRALAVASHDGLEALTLGSLADAMKMSKSGVVARVGTRETLQLAVLDNYRRRFEAQVMAPARGVEAGLARLRRLFDMSLQQVACGQTAGCFYISCAYEYDDRPGSVRRQLMGSVRAWRDAFSGNAELAVASGQLNAGTDAEQMVFEIYALLLAAQHDMRLLERDDGLAHARAGFERLLVRYGAQGSQP